MTFERKLVELHHHQEAKAKGKAMGGSDVRSDGTAALANDLTKAVEMTDKGEAAAAVASGDGDMTMTEEQEELHRNEWDAVLERSLIAEYKAMVYALDDPVQASTRRASFFCASASFVVLCTVKIGTLL